MTLNNHVFATKLQNRRKLSTLETKTTWGNSNSIAGIVWGQVFFAYVEAP